MSLANINALLLWQRVEPSVLNDDIKGSLQSAIHDPLWLLSRQWQMGEFRAEDAGTAAFSQINAVSSPVQQIKIPHLSKTFSYNIQENPLNKIIESIPAPFNLNTRLEAGRMWQRMLLTAGKKNEWNAFRSNPLVHFKLPEFEYQPDDPEIIAFNDGGYEQLFSLLSNGRMVDGKVLFEEFRKRKPSDFLSGADSDVDELGDRWMNWVHTHLGIEAVGSWNNAALEYKVTLAAALDDKTFYNLKMPEYNGSLLDSYLFEKKGENEGLLAELNKDKIMFHRQTLIPTPVSFPSMPSARWWEIEDSTIDMSNLQADNADIGLLLLSRFSLLYSNDWLICPLTIPVGHIADVKGMRITDVFGIKSKLKPSVQNEMWELFQLTSEDFPAPKGPLYFPSVNNNYLQGEVQEEVHFIRDEMANMVWGVEMLISDSNGNGVDGRNAAIRLEKWLQDLNGKFPENDNIILNDLGANFNYKIGSTVPSNWIPFIPVRPESNNPETVFRRAAMPRFVGNNPASRIRPQTEILKSRSNKSNHYDIQESEIATSGITVRQMWKRARWFDGRTITWLAREKIIGRHIESSGLQFDIIS